MAGNMSGHDVKDPEMGAMAAAVTATRNYSSQANTSMEEPSKFDDGPGEDVTQLMMGHTMSLKDPDNPLVWPIHRRVYVSAVSVAFSFVV